MIQCNNDSILRFHLNLGFIVTTLLQTEGNTYLFHLLYFNFHTCSGVTPYLGTSGENVRINDGPTTIIRSISTHH